MTSRWTAFLTIMPALLSAPASAQTSQQSAADYFHDGAKSFIGEDLNQAAATVQDGLANYPSDADLVELDKLIREAMEQQQQNQGQSNEQEQSENEESEDADGGDQQQQGEQQEGEESESGDDEQEQEQPGEQQDQEDQQEGGEQNEEQSEDDSEQPPSEIPVDSDQLTPEEAERILQALANEEEQLLREVQKVKGRPRRVEKDW